MKKILFTGALALTIVTSMVAGTLAIYTKTLDPLDGTINAKLFELDANEANAETFEVKIAPTEEVESLFKIRNYEDNDVATPTEVGMDLVVQVNYPKAASDAGITATLNLNGLDTTTVSTTETDTVVTKTYTIEDAFVASTAKEIDGNITFEWVADTQPNTTETTHQGEDFGAFEVVITGNQDVN